VIAMTDRVWLRHDYPDADPPQAPGWFHCPEGAVPGWLEIGWIEDPDGPPEPVNHAIAHLVAAQAETAEVKPRGRARRPRAGQAETQTTETEQTQE